MMYFASFTAGKYLVRFPTDLISRVEVLRKVEVGEPDYHISNLLECTCSSSACLSSRKNETKTCWSKVDIEVDKMAGEAVGPWCAKKCHICQLCLMCVQFHAHNTIHIALYFSVIWIEKYDQWHLCLYIVYIIYTIY